MQKTLPVLILTDNVYLAGQFRALLAAKPALATVEFEYRCSPASEEAMRPSGIAPLSVKQEWESFPGRYSLVISAHCKQLFPAGMVQQVRCINVHPGLNPYNRGWFPQVFSILNKLPLGATIHEIDAELDHGPIIAQKPVPVFEHDTSLTAYNRVQAAEIELLDEHLEAIISGDYASFPAHATGNLNLKKDFNKLLTIDRNEVLTFGQAIDRLRALTHGSYQNAFFYDADGRKVFVNLVLTPASEE
jgi:methionyl-tRNA formyltransferase